MKEFYVLQEGVSLGPYGEMKLRSLLEKRVFKYDNLVCPVGSDQWIPAGNLVTQIPRPRLSNLIPRWVGPMVVGMIILTFVFGVVFGITYKIVHGPKTAPREVVMPPKYEEGYRDGFRVGFADARDSKPKKGWNFTDRLARIHSSDEQYVKGWRVGYRVGYTEISR